MINNYFKEKIILFNKEKVQLLANIKLDEFFKKVIILNILLF